MIRFLCIVIFVVLFLIIAIEKLGLPAAVRGETLSLQQFADLADCLSDT